MKSKSANRYPPELRERAVRMLLEHRGEYDSEPTGCYPRYLIKNWLSLRYPEGLAATVQNRCSW